MRSYSSFISLLNSWLHLGCAPWSFIVYFLVPFFFSFFFFLWLIFSFLFLFCVLANFILFFVLVDLILLRDVEQRIGT
jgi:hypothetical protein